MRENEKEREELKASSLKSFIDELKRVSDYSDGWDLYTVPSQAKLQKSLN